MNFKSISNQRKKEIRELVTIRMSNPNCRIEKDISSILKTKKLKNDIERLYAMSLLAVY